MYDLQEIEAIKRIKYRYLRCLDCKLWDELKECFIPDATAAYGGGKYSFETRDEIVEFLVEFLGHDTVLTMHHAHQPEIELTSATTATGIWALEDRVINLDLDITIRGAAFYRDEYVKVQGEWKFASTGYQRVYEEVESRKDTASLQVTDNMFVDTAG